MKVIERSRARALRRDGRSIKDIARTLGVAQSSASIWVRDIVLTPEQSAELRRRRGMHPRQVSARELRSERFRALRLRAQQEGRLYARAGDPLHAAGCMLYWGEGAKTRNVVRIANSDPEVLRVFLGFIRAYFAVPPARVRVTCNLFADHVDRRREIERFWLDQLDLGAESLCKSTINTHSKYSQKKRTNRLPYGTCRVSVGDTAIVQHIYGAIQEYGGFERPEWLDGLSPAARPARS